jgi:hypothetical protein
MPNRPAFVLFGLIALTAWAGSRFVQNTGGLPTASTDGVSLVEVTGCRGSVRYTDGGSVSGGKLIPYYYDSVVGWTEGAKANQCLLDTDTQADGGTRRAQVCEWPVAVGFGRVALVSTGLTPQATGHRPARVLGPQRADH